MELSEWEQQMCERIAASLLGTHVSQGMENRTRGTDVPDSGGPQQNAQAKMFSFDVVGVAGSRF